MTFDNPVYPEHYVATLIREIEHLKKRLDLAIEENGELKAQILSLEQERTWE